MPQRSAAMTLSGQHRFATAVVLALAAAHFSVQVHGLYALRALPHEIAGFSEDRTCSAAIFHLSTEPLDSIFKHSNRREGRGWSGVVTRSYVHLTNPGTSLTRKAVVFACANTLICFSAVFLGGIFVRWLLRHRPHFRSANTESPR